MEWKEHVAWLVPIAITMAVAVLFQYGSKLKNHPPWRKAVLVFLFVSLLTIGVAGFFGAMLNKNAPIAGGSTIHLLQGVKP